MVVEIAHKVKIFCPIRLMWLEQVLWVIKNLITPRQFSRINGKFAYRIVGLIRCLLRHLAPTDLMAIIPHSYLTRFGTTVQYMYSRTTNGGLIIPPRGIILSQYIGIWIGCLLQWYSSVIRILDPLTITTAVFIGLWQMIECNRVTTDYGIIKVLIKGKLIIIDVNREWLVISIYELQ